MNKELYDNHEFLDKHYYENEILTVHHTTKPDELHVLKSCSCGKWVFFDDGIPKHYFPNINVDITCLIIRKLPKELIKDFLFNMSMPSKKEQILKEKWIVVI